jgi:hypothetical protein
MNITSGGRITCFRGPHFAHEWHSQLNLVFAREPRLHVLKRSIKKCGHVTVHV